MFAIRRTTQRWRATAIIIVAISIPFAIFSVVYPVSAAALSQLQAYSQYSAGYIFLDSGSQVGGNLTGTQFLSDRNLSSIGTLQGVRAVYGVVDIVVFTDVGKNLSTKICPGLSAGFHCQLALSIAAFDSAAFTKVALPYQILSGRFPGSNDTDAIAIQDNLANALSIGVGDNIVMTQSGGSQVRNVTARVVGVYSPPSGVLSALGGIMDIKEAIAEFPRYQGLYSSAWISTNNLESVKATGQILQTMFPSFHVYYPQLLLQQSLQLLQSASNTYTFLWILAMASALAATLTVRTLDYQSRKSELGLYLSQGWRTWDLFRHEVELSAIYGLVGSTIAVTLGFALRDSIIALIGLGAPVSLVSASQGTYFLATAAVFVFAFLFSLLVPAFNYSRMKRASPMDLFR